MLGIAGTIGGSFFKVCGCGAVNVVELERLGRGVGLVWLQRARAQGMCGGAVAAQHSDWFGV